MKLIKAIIKGLIFILNLPARGIAYLIKKLNKFNDYLNDTSMEKISVRFDDEGRYLEYVFFNKKALDAYEGLKSAYHHLINDATYLTFGNNKVIMSFVKTEKTVKSVHYNVVVTNTTTFEEFYAKVLDRVESLLNQAYPELPYIEHFIIKVWNVDSVQNKHIKITRDARTILPKVTTFKQQIRSASTLSTTKVKKSNHNITPISLKKIPKLKKQFYTMDIETVNLNGIQIPAIITFVGKKFSHYFSIDSNSRNVEEIT